MMRTWKTEMVMKCGEKDKSTIHSDENMED